jgi:hypothetical protein
MNKQVVIVDDKILLSREQRDYSAPDDPSITANRFSSSRILRCISPSLRNAAVDLNQSRLSKAGIPEITLPAGTS